MQTITPFLWFDGNAEEAMDFYTEVFKDSEVLSVSRVGETGDVMIASFKLNGQEFMALNGGPEHANFTEAISLFVSCDTQEEVDELWEKLTDGGAEVQCGWLVDKFGLSWQIIPKVLSELLGSPDREKAGHAMQAMLKMTKIESDVLRRAYDGEAVE